MRRTAIRRKSPARKIKQELDLLLKAHVHERDGYACLKCGRYGKGLQAAHIFPKGKYQRLRFDPLNLLTLCVGCHLFWAHKDPIGFYEWIREKWPMRIEQLKVCAAVARKLDLQELLIYWTEQIDKESGIIIRET